MKRRGLLALLLMPFGQSTFWVGDSTQIVDARNAQRNWEIALPDKLTVTTRDGWSKTFTHDELKAILEEK